MTKPLPNCAACGDRISAATLKDQGPGFECDGKDHMICKACWGLGENDSSWDDRIKDRIRRKWKRPARDKAGG